MLQAVFLYLKCFKEVQIRFPTTHLFTACDVRLWVYKNTNLTNSFSWQMPSKLLQNHTFSIDLRLNYFNFIFYIILFSNIKNMLSLHLISITSTLVLRQIVIFSSHYCLNVSFYSPLKYYLFEIEVVLNITYLFILKWLFSFDQMSKRLIFWNSTLLLSSYTNKGWFSCWFCRLEST